MQSKSILTSKTFWFNMLTIALAVITITDPSLIGVSAKQMLWASGVINIVLRFITSGAVSLTGSAAPTQGEKQL